MKKSHLVVLVLCAPLFACDNSSSSATTPSATPSAPPPVVSSVAPQAEAPKPHGPRGFGPSWMLLHASESLPLADDKKAQLTKIEDSTKPDETAAAAKSERKALHEEILAQVKAGKIDNSKIDPHLAALEKDVQARQEKDMAALDQLHALLDAGQRKTVTADVRKKWDERAAKMDKMMAAKKDELSKKRMDRMTSELTLDDAQQKKVQAILDKDATNPADIHAQMKKDNDALLTAFEGDTFDAKKQDIFTNAPKNARAMAKKEVDFLSQLLPILKPDQKDKLAAKLDKRGASMDRAAGKGMPMPPLFMEDAHEEGAGDGSGGGAH